MPNGNFFARFRRAWRAASSFQTYEELADLPEFWDKEDGLTLSAFFASPTGRKLKIRLTNLMLKSAVFATRQAGDLQFHCGKAVGISETVTAIEQHLSQAAAHSGTDEPEAAAGDVEQYAA